MARLFILTVFLFSGILSFSQIRNIPAEVEDAFLKQYPEAEKVEYKDNLIHVRVNFLVNGEQMTATYTNKGAWKETEKVWTYDQLSEEVKDGFQKSKYADWKVTETHVIYRPDGKERFQIKVEKSDLQKKSLLFNANGRLIEDIITI